MILFIYGPRDCGKSAYAEDRACLIGENRIYLATMKIMDDEGRKRVDKHRALRAGKGFITIECPNTIDSIELPETEGTQVVLLECVSNLVGNEMFNTGCDNTTQVSITENSNCDKEHTRKETGELSDGPKSVQTTVNITLNEIGLLSKRTDNLVIVSSNYDGEELTMDEGTLNYITALNTVNDKLMQMADEVVRF